MRIRFMICLFLVPVAVWAVSSGMESVFNQRLREPVLRMHPDATADDLAKVSVRTLCARKIPQLRLICSIYKNLRRIRIWAVAAVLAGMLALGSGYVARRGSPEARQRLAFLLEKLKLPLTGVFAAVHFALAAACLYCVSHVFLGGPDRVFLAVSFLLAAGLVAVMSLQVNAGIRAASGAGRR